MSPACSPNVVVERADVPTLRPRRLPRSSRRAVRYVGHTFACICPRSLTAQPCQAPLIFPLGPRQRFVGAIRTTGDTSPGPGTPRGETPAQNPYREKGEEHAAGEAAEFLEHLDSCHSLLTRCRG